MEAQPWAFSARPGSARLPELASAVPSPAWMQVLTPVANSGAPRKSRMGDNENSVFCVVATPRRTEPSMDFQFLRSWKMSSPGERAVCLALQTREPQTCLGPPPTALQAALVSPRSCFSRGLPAAEPRCRRRRTVVRHPRQARPVRVSPARQRHLTSILCDLHTANTSKPRRSSRLSSRLLSVAQLLRHRKSARQGRNRTGHSDTPRQPVQCSPLPYLPAPSDKLLSNSLHPSRRGHSCWTWAPRMPSLLLFLPSWSRARSVGTCRGGGLWVSRVRAS
ncbi:hypothetical protein K466DRAFT_115757 [Polyporus arcularius HHB13444]|uniref:Uncharacterized protein n=1 Tax=Polyporus arcularius HHB13444 TaxID=1314778 RepID=A0A5C3PCI8_9APHY|nr:hypothetical protein K466DRAFT_115757 [Polyporus arcularius HHB13444]